MKIKDLIKLLEEVENKEKYIQLIGNETNGEDKDFDISFEDIEVWNDGDESVTLFLSNRINQNKDTEDEVCDMLYGVDNNQYNK